MCSLQQSWEERWRFTRERTKTHVPRVTCAVASRCQSLDLTSGLTSEFSGFSSTPHFGNLDKDPSQLHRLCFTFHWVRRCGLLGQKVTSGCNFITLLKAYWTSGFLTWDLQTLWNCLQNVICGFFGWKMSGSIVLIKFSEWFLTQDNSRTTALCY